MGTRNIGQSVSFCTAPMPPLYGLPLPSVRLSYGMHGPHRGGRSIPDSKIGIEELIASYRSDRIEYSTDILIDCLHPVRSVTRTLTPVMWGVTTDLVQNSVNGVVVPVRFMGTRSGRLYRLIEYAVPICRNGRKWSAHDSAPQV